MYQPVAGELIRAVCACATHDRAGRRRAGDYFTSPSLSDNSLRDLCRVRIAPRDSSLTPPPPPLHPASLCRETRRRRHAVLPAVMMRRVVRHSSPTPPPTLLLLLLLLLLRPGRASERRDKARKFDCDSRMREIDMPPR